MSRRNGIGVAVLIAGATATLLGVLWFRDSPRGITKATADRIEEGMPEEAVVRLVGTPPGDYRRRPLDADAAGRLDTAREDCQGWMIHKAETALDRGQLEAELAKARRAYHPRAPADPTLRLKEWSADNGALFVYFDENGRAKYFKYRHYREQTSLVARIREWLPF